MNPLAGAGSLQVGESEVHRNAIDPMLVRRRTAATQPFFSDYLPCKPLLDERHSDSFCSFVLFHAGDAARSMLSPWDMRTHIFVRAI